MEKRAVNQKGALEVKRPYSPAIVYGDMVFLSGQIPQNPATGDLIRGDLREQTRAVLDNVARLLEAAGSDMAHVLKVTVFLADMDDYAAFNEVYKDYFKDVPPARSCVQAGRLPFDVKVEIEAIATKA
ncbi:MAG TPA: Rid family detoxifying hydrolase [Candidatus Brocadiia bacterium]|nr:Rid family detoxifying hydrolase [Candidatus Brocadiia bacterium]